VNEQSHNVPRKFAAELLNVSLRTLDRYSKKSTISSLRRGRELFFNEQEILDFKAQILAKEQFEQIQKTRQQAPHKKPIRDFSSVEEAQVLEQQSARKGEPETYDDLDAGFADIRDSLLRRSPEESIFKALFHKAEEELKSLRQKLEAAHYQIGKLESEVQTMIPQIEYKKQKQELLSLSEENRFKQQDIAQLEKQVKVEQFVKKVYAVFLFFMMATMPLLLILRILS
jgi:hypothetical protein